MHSFRHSSQCLFSADAKLLKLCLVQGCPSLVHHAHTYSLLTHAVCSWARLCSRNTHAVCSPVHTIHEVCSPKNHAHAVWSPMHQEYAACSLCGGSICSILTHAPGVCSMLTCGGGICSMLTPLQRTCNVLGCAEFIWILPNSHHCHVTWSSTHPARRCAHPW